MLTSPSTPNGAAVAVVGSGLSLLHTQPLLSELDPTGAMVGNTVMYGTGTHIKVEPHLPTGEPDRNWLNEDFFALPGADWYWGSAVSASIYRGRFVAALPSFSGPGAGCTTGWMNVAVSTTSDPLKPWIRYRLSIGDGWSDSIQIGVSDDKVVLSTNRWDLDAGQSDCLGSPYEGARLRVMDWADLLDGGTLTTLDVSPAAYTSYYNWVGATNVPTTAATTSANTLHLAGDKLVGTWGHVVYASITGSVKGGTAKLARNEDLTAAGTVPQLTLPPATIAAFPSGNGYQDERIVSVSYRSSRLWLTSTTSCMVPEDTMLRACARFVLLNTSTTPATKVESAVLTDLERDTFLPLVGFSRDGGAYFSMAASSAVVHEPIDELATYRAAGQPLVGGENEVTIWQGELDFGYEYWGSTGSVIAVPNDSRAVLAVYTASAESNPHVGWATQLRGGQTGDPGGSIYKFHDGSGFAQSPALWVTLRPLGTSPIALLRVSAAPDVESTPGGPHLVVGRDLPPLALLRPVNLADPELGGTADPPTVTLYVQWQTWDGIWSSPISATATIDAVAPISGPPLVAFTPGAITSKIPVKVSWTASDALSGISKFVYDEARQEPTEAFFHAEYTATTLNTTRTFSMGASYAYYLTVTAYDGAGNLNTAPGIPVSFSSVPSSVNISFYKTWSTGTSSSYLGGSTRYATSAGATVTYTFTGRAIGFVSTKAANRGKAEIWIDGVKRTTVDLYSATTKYRQLVFQTSWASNEPHTIMVKVLGTSGRPRVDFDSFLKAYAIVY